MNSYSLKPLVFSQPLFSFPIIPIGLICVKGPDAKKFLQGQVTCDLQVITEEQSCLGANCNPKGRVQATFRLFQLEKESYGLLIELSMIKVLIENLKKYALFSKVEILDVSLDYNIFGISGATFPAEKINPLNKNNAVLMQEDARYLMICPLQGRFIIINKNTLFTRDVENSSLPAYWYFLDIQAGLASVFPETQGLFTPQELNFHTLGGVSFKKGCYIGQEIIARMHYHGKLKNSLFSAQFKTVSPLAPGTRIFNGSQPVGYLVMSALHSDNICHALINIPESALKQLLHIENFPDIILTQIALTNPF